MIQNFNSVLPKMILDFKIIFNNIIQKFMNDMFKKKHFQVVFHSNFQENRMNVIRLREKSRPVS